MLAFLFAPRIARHWPLVKILDAIGLGVFAAIGSAKAISFGLGPIAIIFCGTVSAVGGGMIRDALTGEIPEIMKTGFYATSAIMGSTLMAIIGSATETSIIIVALTTTGIRLIAWKYNAQLPRTKRLEYAPGDDPNNPYTQTKLKVKKLRTKK